MVSRISKMGVEEGVGRRYGKVNYLYPFFEEKDRYERVLENDKTPDGGYRIKERSLSGKRDRITYLDSNGKIEKEIILV